MTSRYPPRKRSLCQRAMEKLDALGVTIVLTLLVGAGVSVAVRYFGGM